MVNYNVTIHKAEWGGVLVWNSTWAADGQVFSVPSGQSFSAKWSLTDGVMSSENTSYMSYEKYGEMVSTTSITVRSDLDIWPSIAPEGVTFVYSVSTSTPGATLQITVGGVSSDTSVTSPPHKYLNLNATAPNGYNFDHWNVSIDGGAEEFLSNTLRYSTSYPPGWDTEYIAYFVAQETCTLTFQVGASGHGAVRTDGAGSSQVTISNVPIGTQMSVNSSGVITVGSIGTCTPEADQGYMFDSWNPSVPSSVSGATTYTAIFVEEASYHALTLSVSSQFTGCSAKMYYNGSLRGTVNAGGSQTFQIPTNASNVIVEAVETIGQSFTAWLSGQTIVSDMKTANITSRFQQLSGVSPFFVAAMSCTLTVNRSDYATIKVDNITVSQSTYSKTINERTQFVLEATLATGRSFDHWHGDGPQGESWDIYSDSPGVTINGNVVTYTSKISRSSETYTLYLDAVAVINITLYIGNTYANTVFPQLSKLKLAGSSQTFNGVTVSNLEDD